MNRFVLLACSLVLALSQASMAARLLDAYIEKNGDIVAHFYYQDTGREDAATVWRYLGEHPIMVDEKVILMPDADTPLSVTLIGNLTVRLQHTDSVLASGNFSKLTFVRPDASGQDWHMIAGEVERTAGIAGLGPSTGRKVDGMVVMAGVGLLVVVVVIAAAVGFAVLVVLKLRSKPSVVAMESAE